MNSFYKDKTVLITGAANGIGKAIAEAAADAGASLVIGDIDGKRLEETSSTLRATGAKVEAQVCDVRDTNQTVSLVAAAKEKFGHPDVVFANAGIEGPLSTPWDYSEEDFKLIIDVNLLGIWRLLKAVLPDMVSRGSGSIVATSSVAGLVGADGMAAYAASKHAVVGLARSTALAVAKAGVRVNALCPGPVDTAMIGRLAGANPAATDAFLGSTPLGRLGTTEETAQAALWLASDQASFVTGHALAVDGGYLAH